jgi:hypothetical protein
MRPPLIDPAGTTTMHFGTFNLVEDGVPGSYDEAMDVDDDEYARSNAHGQGADAYMEVDGIEGEQAELDAMDEDDEANEVLGEDGGDGDGLGMFSLAVR